MEGFYGADGGVAFGRRAGAEVDFCVVGGEVETAVVSAVGKG